MAKLPELWGLAEFAAELGCTKQALHNRLTRGTIPPPDYELACGPIWRAAPLKKRIK